MNQNDKNDRSDPISGIDKFTERHMATTTTITRKEAHAEGIRFLREALEAADQADGCFRDADTRHYIETRGPAGILTLQRVVEYLQGNLKSATGATCEACDKKIADCQCRWANQEVR